MPTHRICMVVFSIYPEDVRVRNEAEALVKKGYQVDVFCLMRSRAERYERINGVDVFRINLEQKRAGMLRYIYQYGFFLLAALIRVAGRHFVKPYSVIHIHNMPDILVFAGLLPKITGSKIILDLHDPMPELFLSMFKKEFSPYIFRMLVLFEKISIRFADLVITTNISFRDLFISRGCPPEKIHIVMNAPQEEIFTKFKSNPELKDPQSHPRFAIMHHGLIAERHGLDMAIRALSVLRDKIPNISMHIYGEGPFLDEIQRLIDELNLRDIVYIHGTVSIEEIATAIPEMDLGIIPNRLSPFTNLNFPTRIFEFLRAGVPVVVPRTQGIQDYFDDESIFFFEPGNIDDLARAIHEVYAYPLKRQSRLERGREIYQRHRWEYQREELLRLVESLLVHDKAKV